MRYDDVVICAIQGETRGQTLQFEPAFVLGIPDPPPQNEGNDVPAFNYSTSRMKKNNVTKQICSPDTATAAIRWLPAGAAITPCVTGKE